MREHDHEGDAAFRPSGDRVAHEDHDLLGRAAAAGRPDVLGAAGLLDLQRAVGNAGASSLVEEVGESPVHDVVRSGGSPLDAGVREDMEARFGQDFGDVRVHTDDAAHESAKSVDAHAYTVGSDIVFQRDRYDPASDSGRHVLAHELTHVVQQRNGPVEGTDTGDGVRVSDPSDRFEREASSNADRIMSAPTPQRTETPVAQREEASLEDVPEETAQTYVAPSVQRDEDEEEAV